MIRRGATRPSAALLAVLATVLLATVGAPTAGAREPAATGRVAAQAVDGSGPLHPAAAARLAGSVDDAVAALQTGNSYVDPAAKGRGATVGDVALPANVKIAVFPDSAGDSAALASTIGHDLGASPTYHLTVGVFTVTEDRHGSFDAVSSTYCEGAADHAAKLATEANTSTLSSLNLAPTITSFLGLLNRAPVDTGNCTVASNVGGADSTATSDSGSSSSGATILLVILLLAVLGGGGYVWYRRRSRRRDLSLARAKVQPYVDRLANDINTIDPKGNPKATQAMGDAAERYSAAGGQLATADTVEKVAIARRTVLEGLYASRLARTELGLEPGPDLPPIDDTGHPHLTEEQEVQVRGQTYQGYPQYTPGAPYYYGGGYGVPGGWYGSPFWETLLLGSVLSGGFGGWGYGGGGYDAGYNAGYDAGNDGGNDTGANGGGDFGGGGGDFGGGFGGGDFGGGGGDFGGGFGGGGDGGGSW